MQFAILSALRRRTHRRHGPNRFPPREEAGLVPNSASLVSACPSQYHPGYPRAKSFTWNTYAKWGEGGGVGARLKTLHSMLSLYSLSFHILADTLHKPIARNLQQLFCFDILPHTCQNNGGCGLIRLPIFQFPLFNFPLFQILQNSSWRSSSATMELL